MLVHFVVWLVHHADHVHWIYVISLSASFNRTESSLKDNIYVFCLFVNNGRTEIPILISCTYLCSLRAITR